MRAFAELLDRLSLTGSRNAKLVLLRDYLNRKGRLLLLLDARMKTGLEPLLQEWGALSGGLVALLQPWIDRLL